MVLPSEGKHVYRARRSLWLSLAAVTVGCFLAVWVLLYAGIDVSALGTKTKMWWYALLVAGFALGLDWFFLRLRMETREDGFTYRDMSVSVACSWADVVELSATYGRYGQASLIVPAATATGTAIRKQVELRDDGNVALGLDGLAKPFEGSKLEADLRRHIPRVFEGHRVSAS